MILRSPLTTSADVDQVPLMASDERRGGTRTTERIVGRERTCDFEFQRWLWLRLCHRLFGDCVGENAECHLGAFTRLATGDSQV